VIRFVSKYAPKPTFLSTRFLKLTYRVVVKQSMFDSLNQAGYFD
jgi:hypothetical protein